MADTHTHTHTHMQELLKCCVGRCVEKLPTNPKEGSKKKIAMEPLVGSIQATFRYIPTLWHSFLMFSAPVSLFAISLHRAVESGLKYKFYSSWDHILKVLATFYQVAAGSSLCQPFMAKVRCH